MMGIAQTCLTQEFAKPLSGLKTEKLLAKIWSWLIPIGVRTIDYAAALWEDSTPSYKFSGKKRHAPHILDYWSVPFHLIE